MSRITILIATVAALALAGCTTGSADPGGRVTATSGAEGILVTGVGEVTGTPDTVQVDIGVSVLGATVAEAAERAAQKAEALIAALTDGGVDPTDITTTDYSIYPEYDYRDNTERLVGYRVTNTVRAKIRNVTQAGDVIDSAVEAAGDETRIGGLSFSIEDDSALVSAAREAAWEDALAKATQLATLSGLTLGPALSITETSVGPPSPVPFADMAERAASTPIQPGTSTVTIVLEVRFELLGS